MIRPYAQYSDSQIQSTFEGYIVHGSFKSPSALMQIGIAGLATLALSMTLTSAASENGPSSRSAGTKAPKTVERHIIRELIEQAETRRIDIVSLGDSNQLFYSFGWQDGWSHALGARYEMYATPILGAGRDVGIGLGNEVNESSLLIPFGAPPEWSLYNNPDSGIDDTPYGYLNPVIQIRPGFLAGMRLRIGNGIWPENNFDETAALRAHFTYGVGPFGGGTTMQPGVRQTLGESYTHDPIDTMAEEYGIESGWVEVPAGKRNLNDLEFNWFQGNSNVIHGPFFGMYMRFENTTIDHGFSNHTLYWTGGAGARLCALNLQNASDEHLIAFFDRVRELQPAEKKILIRIAFGGNDRTDSLGSVGPNGGQPSNTPGGVADNHIAIINRIKEVWTAAGWDQDELTFLLVGNHRKPSEPTGFGFRDTIANLARQLNRVAFVNLAELASPLDMSLNEWYFDSGAHLTQQGYRAINTREIAALIDLPADINNDCVVDTADLAIMLGVFGKTNLSEKALGPDLNFDGLVDTSDLGELITKFGDTCPD